MTVRIGLIGAGGMGRAHLARIAGVLSGGEIVAEGAPSEIVIPSVIESVFGIAASVVADPTTGDPVVIPHRRKREKS